MEDENVRKYREQIERFFAEFADVIINFSKEHNLLIDKFPNNSVTLYLKFAHPKGGEGFISLAKGLCNTVGVWGHWYLEDTNEDRRYIKKTAPVFVPFSLKEVLIDYLTRELATVVSWEVGDWSSVVNNFRRNMAPIFKKDYINKTEKLFAPSFNPNTAVRGCANCVVVVCSACRHENEFKQPYPYSAGFGDQGFLYNDDGNLTLTWGIYDKTYMKLYPKEHPTVLGVDAIKKFEDMLLPAPHGGRWRFENPARCLKCGKKISGAIMSHTPYLLYDGSIETEKLKDGFASVLKK